MKRTMAERLAFLEGVLRDLLARAKDDEPGAAALLAAVWRRYEGLLLLN